MAAQLGGGFNTEVFQKHQAELDQWKLKIESHILKHKVPDRVSAMSKKLKSELGALESSAQLQWKNFLKEKKQAQEAAERAQDKLDKLKNVTSQAYLVASENLEQALPSSPGGT